MLENEIQKVAFNQIETNSVYMTVVKDGRAEAIRFGLGHYRPSTENAESGHYSLASED